jgi:hypothetical protein
MGLLHQVVQPSLGLLSFIEAFRTMGFLFLAIIPLICARRRGTRPRRKYHEGSSDFREHGKDGHSPVAARAGVCRGRLPSGGA